MIVVDRDARHGRDHRIRDSGCVERIRVSYWEKEACYSRQGRDVRRADGLDCDVGVRGTVAWCKGAGVRARLELICLCIRRLLQYGSFYCRRGLWWDERGREGRRSGVSGVVCCWLGPSERGPRLGGTCEVLIRHGERDGVGVRSVERESSMNTVAFREEKQQRSDKIRSGIGGGSRKKQA